MRQLPAQLVGTSGDLNTGCSTDGPKVLVGLWRRWGRGQGSHRGGVGRSGGCLQGSCYFPHP